MPAPAVTAIVAIISSFAAIIAFKEFVYEPHLAHRVESWLEERLHERRMRRRGAQAVPAPVDSESKETLRPGEKGDVHDEEEHEMNPLDVNVWRSEVDRSQPSSLRQRNVHVPEQNPTSEPSLIIFDASAMQTTTSSPLGMDTGTNTITTPTDPLRSPFLSLSELGSDMEADMVSAMSNISADEHESANMSEASWTSVRGA